MNNIAIVISIISLIISGYLFYHKLMLKNNVNSKLKVIQNLALDIVSKIPDNLGKRLGVLEDVSDKTVSGLLGLVKNITVNNKNYLNNLLKDKNFNSKYTQQIKSVVNVITNNLINIVGVKVTSDYILIFITFGKLTINVNTGDYIKEGEFANIDLSFLDGNVTITN